VHLLIVDDDAVFREELGDLLTSDGHHVATAPSVPKAIEQLEERDFDVVFTDLKMPRQSGMDLLKQVRLRWPRTLVVMVTGFASVDTAVEAMKVGAFDYIRKPFQLEQVHQVLALAHQELQFRAAPDGGRSVDAMVRRWADREGLEVLHLTPRKVRPHEHVQVFVPDLENPFRIADTVTAFLSTHPKTGLVLEGAETLFRQHRRKDILDFVEGLRRRMEAHGPFVITFDPKQINAGDVADLRAAVVAATTRSTLEAVLRRAAEGPCSFTEAMKAAGLDDSPKLSFHLRRLVEDGLLAHQGDEYRITPRGRESIRLLGEIDAMAAFGNTVLPTSSGG